MDSFFPHLEGVTPAPGFADLAEQAKAAEAWATDRWAARRILDVELMTPRVIDPCCGTGVLTEAAEDAGYEEVLALDLYDWGFLAESGVDWLSVSIEDLRDLWGERTPSDEEGFTVYMNPPFSKACEFVDQAFALGARKVLCFQRQAWRESRDRREWWNARPPARIWLCGDRAHTWLFHIPPEDRKGGRQMPSAWFVWERGHRGIEAGGTIWKNGVDQ